MFTDPCQLGARNIIVSESDQDAFLRRVYRPYIQSVIDHIPSRLQSSDVFSAFSVFDPSNLPDSEESLTFYGTENIKVLTDFYGHEQQVTFQGKIGHSNPDVDPEQTEAEWKIFRRIMFANLKTDMDGDDSIPSTQRVMYSLLTSDTLSSGFPNLVKLATIALVLPVTTATVERTFSDMKLIKTIKKHTWRRHTRLYNACMHGGS